MKKFITVTPLQMRGGLKKTAYRCDNNETIRWEVPCSFPILPVIASKAEQGERIGILTIHTTADSVEDNDDQFREQLEEVRQNAGFEYGITRITVPHTETQDKHLSLFSRLIDQFEQDDELYACLTFGDKPTAIVLFLGLNYAYKLRNASVETLIYGMIPNHAENKGVLYDITSLFYLNSIVENAGVFGDTDSEKIARLLLGLA